MTGYLLDTNVVSELTRSTPDPQVVAFLNEQEDLWLSSILMHELEFGLQLLPPGRRRDLLYAMKSSIESMYNGRILSLDVPAAEWAAQLRAQARRSGRVLDMGDALIAGIARANRLVLATRNIADFQAIDVEVVNPWTAQ